MVYNYFLYTYFSCFHCRWYWKHTFLSLNLNNLMQLMVQINTKKIIELHITIDIIIAIIVVIKK